MRCGSDEDVEGDLSESGEGRAIRFFEDEEINLPGEATTEGDDLEDEYRAYARSYYSNRRTEGPHLRDVCREKGKKKREEEEGQLDRLSGFS